MPTFSKLKPLCIYLVVACVTFAGACASQSPPTRSADPSDSSFNNPGTLPTESTPSSTEYSLDIGTTVAFLDSCISDSGLDGPCHCAAELLVYEVDSNDIAALEDRMSAFNEFPSELAGLLVQCRGVERPPAWETSTKEIYLAACTQSSDRLLDLCRCSASRAADVIPEERLSEFLSATDLRPNMADLISACL